MKTTTEKLQIKIAEYLSKRAFNALRLMLDKNENEMDLLTLGDLLSISKKDFLKRLNVGKRTIRKFENLMDYHRTIRELENLMDYHGVLWIENTKPEPKIDPNSTNVVLLLPNENMEVDLGVKNISTLPRKGDKISWWMNESHPVLFEQGLGDKYALDIDVLNIEITDVFFVYQGLELSNIQLHCVESDGQELNFKKHQGN